MSYIIKDGEAPRYFKGLIEENKFDSHDWGDRQQEAQRFATAHAAWRFLALLEVEGGACLTNEKVVRLKARSERLAPAPAPVDDGPPRVGDLVRYWTYGTFSHFDCFDTVEMAYGFWNGKAHATWVDAKRVEVVSRAKAAA